MQLANELHSADGSIKSLWEIRPGISVESVRFPLAGRLHICISSQAGCNLACQFCETGKQKNMHDLSAAEIVAQVTGSLAALPAASGARFHVVQFAGMGEPLLNFEAVAEATRRMIGEGITDEVTLTTAGIAPALTMLAGIPLSRLNVSLHASTNETRSRIVPINRKYPIEQLMAAVHEYHDRSGVPVTVNYLLFDGVNDADDDVERLARLLAFKDHRYSVRLKAWNPIDGSGLAISPRSRFAYFQTVLAQAGFDVLLCESMGSDVGAGCGQLRSMERQLIRRKVVPVAQL